MKTIETVEQFIARGGNITILPPNKRAYRPWEMFCLMRGVDPKEPQNQEWAKKFCQRGHFFVSN